MMTIRPCKLEDETNLNTEEETIVSDFENKEKNQTERRRKKMVKPYKRLQSHGHVKKGLPLQQVACCLLSCREHSTLNFCLCRPTVTLHQGQGHRNEHEHIWHP